MMIAIRRAAFIRSVESSVEKLDAILDGLPAVSEGQAQDIVRAVKVAVEIARTYAERDGHTDDTDIEALEDDGEHDSAAEAVAFEALGIMLPYLRDYADDPVPPVLTDDTIDVLRRTRMYFADVLRPVTRIDDPYGTLRGTTYGR